MSKLISTLERHEGFRSRPYLDTVGVWTFGHGFTFITEDESRVVLKMKVRKIKKELGTRLLGMSWNRKDVIVNMAYNLGVAGVLSFKNMWAAIDRKDWEEAARQMLQSKWHIQVGNRAKELAKIMVEG